MTLKHRRKDSKITSELVSETLGNVSEAAIAAILESGATVEELEEAAAWARGESDVIGELERPLSGRVAAIYDILTNEREEQWQEEGLG